MQNQLKWAKDYIKVHEMSLKAYPEGEPSYSEKALYDLAKAIVADSKET
jgi:hypothetical protein